MSVAKREEMEPPTLHTDTNARAGTGVQYTTVEYAVQRDSDPERRTAEWSGVRSRTLDERASGEIDSRASPETRDETTLSHNELEY
jgi:hypothetical protein